MNGGPSFGSDAQRAQRSGLSRASCVLRGAPVIATLFVALVGAVLLVLLYDGGGPAAVDAEDESAPGMSLLVNGLPCQAGKCTATVGETFTVTVVTDPAPGRFSAYKIVLEHTGVNLKQRAGFDENKAPKCHLGSEQKLTNRYILSCKLTLSFGDLVIYNGPLANVDFNCKSEQGSITLLAGIGNSQYSVPGSTLPVTVPIKFPDSVVINCATPTPTPTDASTPTNTPTNTSTPTNTPTNTPTSRETNTPTNTNTQTNTPTGTLPLEETNTPTNTPTDTLTETLTPTGTLTPADTGTPTFTSTAVPTFTPTSSVSTSTPTPTPPGGAPPDTPSSGATSTPGTAGTPGTTPTSDVQGTSQPPPGTPDPTNTPTSNVFGLPNSGGSLGHAGGGMAVFTIMAMGVAIAGAVLWRTGRLAFTRSARQPGAFRPTWRPAPSPRRKPQ